VITTGSSHYNIWSKKVRDLLTISDKEFQHIRELVYKNFGINLTEQKRALVVGRLNKVLREKEYDSFKTYYDSIMSDKTGDMLSELVDRISTNHTFFNRENDHFEHLANNVFPSVIPALKNANKKKLRIWVAGCSSGEESSMIAILLTEHLGNEINQWDIGILATDISVSALEKAVEGNYSKENVSHMPAKLKNKYFQKMPDGSFQVSDKIRKMMTYRKLNFMSPSYPFRGPFDIILCRNVMIYFDKPTRNRLVERFYDYLVPNGYFYIGHSETLGRNNEMFRYIRPAVYQKEMK